MASSRRLVLGCLLFLFLGFVWVPIWILYSSSDDMDVLLLVDVADSLETTNGHPLPSTQGSPRDIHELPNKLMQIAKLFGGRGRGAVKPTQLPEWSINDQPTSTTIDNSTHTSAQVDDGCDQMKNFRQTTLRWIKILCEVLKRQPISVRVGLLVLMGLTSLILTLIGYKLLCPRIHRREGIEKMYDIEDSWIMFP